MNNLEDSSEQQPEFNSMILEEVADIRKQLKSINNQGMGKVDEQKIIFCEFIVLVL